MNPQELKQKIENLAPETKVEVIDLTGTQDHYEANIVSPVFDGKTAMEQHRLVYDLLDQELKSGEVHALSLKTYSPSEFGGFSPDLQKKAAPRAVEGVSEDSVKRIEKMLSENKVFLFLKGTPEFPQCGFSAQSVQILQALGVSEFGSFDVLSDRPFFEELKVYANWRTSPQLWIKGELVGGSDIMMDLYESGELKQILDKA